MMTIIGNADDVVRFLRWFNAEIGTDYDIDLSNIHETVVTMFELTASEAERIRGRATMQGIREVR